MRKTLTDRTLKALTPAPAGKRYTVWDGIVPSFGARVTDRKHVSFVVMRRLNGKPVRRRIGDYPAMKLETAHDLARAALEDIVRGIDPKARQEARRREEERREKDTFAAVAAEFIKRHVATLERAREVEADFERELTPRWGKRPIGAITRRDVVELVEEVFDRGTPYMARHLLAHVRRLYNWAIAREIYGLEASPCDRLKPSEIIGRSAERTRILSDAEIRHVWAASEGLGYPFGPFARMLLLTGQRLREVAEASWREVDFKEAIWTIPAERMKADAPHVVPLAPDALALLEALPRWTKGDHVFSTTEGARPVGGFSKAKTRLDKAMLARMRDLAENRGEDPKKAKLEPWRWHDLRRTMRTHLSAVPVSDLVRELAIGHTKPGLHKVYDQSAYLDEKRHAFELWGTRLRGIVEPAPENVVELTRARMR